LSDYTLHVGDCREVMAGMDADSVDAVVCDPPYGLSFMGKDWDHGVPGEAFWTEALRVAKPGAHLLAFGGTRTFHRLAVAIEDAGWEIRDCVMWVYGSGFPKSLDVSKAIDKAAGAEREVVGSKLGKPGYADTECTGQMLPQSPGQRDGYLDITAPATPEAQQWQGWGTALKPAWEPIILARRPFKQSVAANVLEHGTGALNVDGCRVEGGERTLIEQRGDSSSTQHTTYGKRYEGSRNAGTTTQGRFPANLIHDGSDEVIGCFPETGASSGRPRNNGEFKSVAKGRELPHVTCGHNDNGGSASRFFYCAKASKADRDGGLVEHLPRARHPRKRWQQDMAGTFISRAKNRHPTVKPTSLMAYLVRLITPPGGTVLDTFMGSGSTGKATIREGFGFIGIDLSQENVAIARARIEYESAKERQGELL